MPITSPPQPPLPIDDQPTFDTKSEAWLQWQYDSAAEFNALENNVVELENNVVEKVDLAMSSGLANAAQNALDAQNASSTAILAAGDAEDSRDAAQSAASLAASARDKAQLWAESETEVETGQYSAKHWAQEAATVVTEGVIDDASTSAVKTWSSQKISAAIDNNTTPVYGYADRADLRSLTPTDGAQALVDKLGLFVFHLGSDEPDDDESCFATDTGRWLLEAVHWDVVDAWLLPDSFDARTLYGTAPCAITSVSNLSTASFVGTVLGAMPGDRVIVTPPAELGSTPADTARLSYYAWVSASNTVTTMLTNASSGAATLNLAVQTAWPLTVIKGVS